MNLPSIISVIVLAAFAAGSGSDMSNLARRHEQLKHVKNVAVMLPYPELTVYDRYSRSAIKNESLTLEVNGLLRKRIGAALDKKGVSSSIVDNLPASQAAEIYGLSRTVISCMEQRTVPYSGYYLPERVQDFSYSVGSMQDIAAKAKADSVLIMFGYADSDTSNSIEDKNSKKQKATDAGREHASFVALSAILVDKEGFVLWAGRISDRYGFGSGFETAEKMDKGLSALLDNDLWGMQWQNYSEK